MNALSKLAGALPQFAVQGIVLAAFWIPMLLCLVVAWTPDPTDVAAQLSGTLAHLAAFAYLSAALFRAHFNEPGEAMFQALAVALWMLAFGVVIEVVQMLFVSGRSGDLLDVAIDAGGIAIGCLAYLGQARARAALTSARVLVG